MEPFSPAIYFANSRFRAFCQSGPDGQINVIVTDAEAWDRNGQPDHGVIVFSDDVRNVPSIGALIGFFAERFPYSFVEHDYHDWVISPDLLARPLDSVPVSQFG